MKIPNDQLFGLAAAAVVLIVFTFRERRLRRKMDRFVNSALLERPLNSSTYIYDKAEYHFESVAKHGLPDHQAYNHTTFFISWLINKSFIARLFQDREKDNLDQYRSGAITINELYERWDCCLTSDMLTAEGNAFAREYFDFSTGIYLKDYSQHLQQGLQSEFHVAYTPENEAQIHQVINSRFNEWLIAHEAQQVVPADSPSTRG